MSELNVLKKMNYIFIDVENVGANFKIYKNDSFEYYYVLHNSMHVDEVNEAKRKYPFIHVINVQVSGEQVSDMCIYSEICKLHYTVPNPKEFFVVSRDKGFKRFSDTSNIAIKCVDQNIFQNNMVKEFIDSNELGKIAIKDAQRIIELDLNLLRIDYDSLGDELKDTVNNLNSKINELDDKVKNLTKENADLKNRLESIKALSIFNNDVIGSPKVDSSVFEDDEFVDILKIVD